MRKKDGLMLGLSKFFNFENWDLIENCLPVGGLKIKNFAVNHFKKIIMASILHTLKLSKSAVNGIARNKGIDLTKNTRESSIGTIRK